MRVSRRCAFVASVPLIVLPMLASCCASSLYELATPNPVVHLPLDESPHCTGGEWWYYSGRLATDQGHGYGIEAVIFHAPGLPPLGLTEVWIAHYAILDEATGVFTYDQTRRLQIPSTIAPVHGFSLSTPILHLQGGDGHDHIQAAMSTGQMALNLDLEDIRGPILYDKTGYVDYGSAGQSFYYSRPRMQATGTLRIDGQDQSVTGTLWFDHQWGRDVDNPWLQWDWFSLRLDDGSCVMLFSFRSSVPPVTMGTYIPAQGEPVSLTSSDFAVTPTRFWQSPHTQNIYPTAWHITIPAQDLTLDVLAVAEDQEFDARSTTLNIYWEGLCAISGTQDTTTISGDAYVEMTNFSSTDSGFRP